VAAAVDDVLAAMAHDKKAKAGQVKWVLLERVGHASWAHAVPDAIVREAVAMTLHPTVA